MSEVIEADNRDMSSDPKLSLIVPVYNTREFLIKTLNSFRGVRNSDYEIIIINDGSTDDSLQVISEWLSTYSGNYLLISQENRGLSEARNTAIKYSRGTYLGFCDSDDWLDTYTISKALILALKNDADIVFFRSLVFNSITKESYLFYDAKHWDDIMQGGYSKITDINESPEILSFEPNTNNRLIRRDFFENFIGEFPSGLHFEDVKPHILSIINAEKIALLNSVGYYYRINREGKITDQKSEKRFDIITTTNDILKSGVLSKLSNYQVTCVIRGLVRILFWCGCNTLMKDRLLFFKTACKLFSTENKESRALLKCALLNVKSKKEFSLMLFLYNNAVRFLVCFSSGESSIRSRLFLLKGFFSSDVKILSALGVKIIQYSKYISLRRIRGR